MTQPVNSVVEPLTLMGEQTVTQDRRGGVVQIRPAPAWPTIDLGELWAYRSLFFFLVWRDIKSRYSQTVLGAGWAVLQPVLSMVVFTIIFGRFAKIPSDGLPYQVFSLTALVPWSYFSTALTSSSNSLVMQSSLVTKVYFPRLVIPSAAVLGAMVDCVIAFVVLLVLMLWYGIVARPVAGLLVPMLVGITTITAIGMGCWLSALNIQFRDFRHLTPFLVQVWMFASPIVYPMSLVPERYRSLYCINPMAGVISAFRSVLLGSTPIPWPELAVSSLSALVILFSGALYFRRTERVFADVA
jgi:lipopolysaccharide transport system permease protein